MNAGEIIKQVDGLNHDKLTYFVRSGYVTPEKVKRGALYYNEFSEEDLNIIKIAWRYIAAYDMKVRSAFERAKKNAQSDQPTLFEMNE